VGCTSILQIIILGQLVEKTDHKNPTKIPTGNKWGKNGRDFEVCGVERWGNKRDGENEQKFGGGVEGWRGGGKGKEHMLSGRRD